MTTRMALSVEYDGSQFYGWQTQLQGRTVQNEIEKALSQVADETVQVACAGRTDTGVHAIGQVIHFDTDAVRSERSWILGANANLPDDISIHWAKPVDTSFHARFTAVSRSYRYVILNRPFRSALYQNRCSWHYQPLNVEQMAMAAQYLVGEHDFTSFRALACQAKHARRNIESLQINRSGDFIIIDITANAFLHHMVRNIVGTLLVIGQEQQSPAWVAELLAAKDRSLAAATAPSQGLYLVSVRYPSEYEILERPITDWMI